LPILGYSTHPQILNLILIEVCLLNLSKNPGQSQLSIFEFCCV